MNTLSTLHTLLFSLVLTIGTLYAHGQRSIAGTVIDGSTSMSLPYATIAHLGSLRGTTSDADGHFELELDVSSGSDSIEVSYIGYQSS